MIVPPPLIAETTVSAAEQENPITCPIVPNREITIEIEKGKMGLGLSIVGGSDTLLVRKEPLLTEFLMSF